MIRQQKQKGLTEAQQQVWDMRMKGESVAQIAYILHISVAAVYQRLNYAEAKVSKLLTEKEDDRKLHSQV
jgi:DNA-binding CsgD family transcriptional regulator